MKISRAETTMYDTSAFSPDLVLCGGGYTSWMGIIPKDITSHPPGVVSPHQLYIPLSHVEVNQIHNPSAFERIREKPK